MIITPTMHLPRYVSDLVGACPRAGEGVHSWLFRCARALHPYRTEGEIISLLEAASHGCAREVPTNEISEAVRNSKQCAPQIGQRCLTRANKPKKWPSQNSNAIAAISRDGHGLADLWELSPCRIEDNLPRTEHIIDELFSDNPLLCVGKSIKHFDTRPREQWRGALHALQLIVPSSMNERYGATLKGKRSAHTKNNTGPRQYLVVEFDSGSYDQHAALLVHLSGMAPLVLAVMSGNKSLHGWFNVQRSGESKQYRFMRYAVSLGADPATWTRCQFVRMPDGVRDNGNRQSILYFNPTNL